MKQLNKKGQAFAQLAGLATGIATLAIVLTVAFLVMSQGKEQIRSVEGLNSSQAACEESLACNATAAMQSATETIPGWVPLVVIASIGAILLGLVAMFKR